jgi:regulator of replication initiation timing
MLKSTVESVVKGVLKELHTQISSLKAKNEALRSENTDLMYRVDILQFRSDAAKQFSRTM